MITTTPELFHALATTPVLTGTNLQAQKLIAGEGRVREFAAMEWIVREGEEGHAFFILVGGEVEVVKRSGTPEELVLCTLKQGEFFGEMCILAPMKRAASIRASQPAGPGHRDQGRDALSSLPEDARPVFHRAAQPGPGPGAAAFPHRRRLRGAGDLRILSLRLSPSGLSHNDSGLLFYRRWTRLLTSLL